MLIPPKSNARAMSMDKKSLSLKFDNMFFPSHFIDKELEICLLLTDDEGKIVTGRRVEFKICLQYTDSDAILDETLLVKDPDKQFICEKTGKSPTLRLQLLKTSSQRRPFTLKVLPQLSEPPCIDEICPVSSPPIHVIRHNLEIMNPRAIPCVFYKEQGGKSNQIEVVVALTNSHGEYVTSQAGLPLKCVLCYEGGLEPWNQKILEINHHTRMFIDCDGKAIIRFRINEVSQKHSSQLFMVKIEADIQANKDNSDIGHCFTPCIEVKSKKVARNKRLRLDQESEQEKQDNEKENVYNAKLFNSDHCSDIHQNPAKRFCTYTAQRLSTLRGRMTEKPTNVSLSSIVNVIDDILEWHKMLGLPIPQGNDASVGSNDVKDASFNVEALFETISRA